jgi:restriction endonuclease
MTGEKGARLEEIVRAYFAKQGFFAMRSVPLRYGQHDVSDVDIWLYARQSATIRTRVVVDVKNKKSPRALERVLWTKGLQTLTNADRAIVVTTDNAPQIAKFGFEQKVTVITKIFLDRLQKTFPGEDRISLEDFLARVRQYGAQKTDGDWIRRLEDAKSSLISLPGFQAFNRAMTNFAFFAERIESRPHYAEQALRCALMCASIACIALDSALERVVFEELPDRYRAIAEGATYGDSGDQRVQKGIDNVLALIEESMENGRVVARQAKEQLQKRFRAVRADIVAEFFSREHNAGQLFPIARELEAFAHQRSAPQTSSLSADSRAVLGVLSDFVQVRRQVIVGTPQGPSSKGPTTNASADEVANTGASSKTAAPEPGKLL